jgi:orotate phosphoribosyltransferase
VVLQWPPLAAALGRALAAPWRGRVDVVVGPAMGGVVIGHETASALGVRMVFTERVDGAMALRRSLAVAAGERALVVENVVTPGGSALEVAELLRAAGAEVAGLATIVDRLPEGATLPLELHALARVTAASWDPSECPACASGGGAEAPGSRRGLPSTRR